MGANWNQTKANAMAILGPKAKIPEAKANMSSGPLDKAVKEYESAVTVLQTKILALQNVCSTTKNAIKQHQDLISRSDFGLDEDEDGVKAKIAKAQDLLDKYLDYVMGTYETEIKNLDELDKHSMSLSKYKPTVS